MARELMGAPASPILGEAVALTDTVYLLNKSDTSGSSFGTVVEASIGQIIATVIIPPTTTIPASIKLLEATNNGVNFATLIGQAVMGGDRVITFQDVTGTVYVSGGTDVPVADGGTGVSTLTSGELVTGAGTSPVTTTAIPAGGLAGITALNLKAPLASPTFTGTVTVPNTSFTYAKLQDVSATDKVLGRSTAGAGVVEEIACTATGRSILDDTSTAAVLTTIGAQPLDADLTTLATAFTSASASGPASLKLAEDTDNGTTGVVLTGPVTSASDKVVSFQDIAGTVYISGGTDVPVADGGTGVSTLASGELVTGAGASPVTTTAIPAGGLAGITALNLKAPLASPTFTGTVTLPATTLGGAVTGADKVISAIELIDYGETSPAASVSGSVTRDFAAGSIHRLTLTGNVTALTISNPPASGIAGTITFVLIQDGTGSRTWSNPGTTVFIGATPGFNTAASKTNVVSYTTFDGGTNWLGFFGGAQA